MSINKNVRFWASGATNKSRLLRQVIEADPFFHDLLSQALQNGITLTFSLSPAPGSYIPSQCGITLSSFSDMGKASLILMHELIHFQQHQENRLITPENSAAITEAEIVEQFMHCEAEAAAESIAGAWRLKSAGHPMSWHGAQRSRQWRALTYHYYISRSAGMEEAEAKEKLTTNWYADKQSRFYKQQAKLLVEHKRQSA